VASKDNLADLFTKGLSEERINCASKGMESKENINCASKGMELKA